MDPNDALPQCQAFRQGTQTQFFSFISLCVELPLNIVNLTSHFLDYYLGSVEDELCSV
ncbi:hypothetical protein Scep_026066 [Stephania cephalantha]|uniref:Uncharacterized protein n=1 Tax=Stephania cephalantha TaxID=152367 RepID=A0AAP0EMN0_9MAGN